MEGLKPVELGARHAGQCNSKECPMAESNRGGVRKKAKAAGKRTGVTREFLGGIGREGGTGKAKPKKKLRRLQGVDKGIIGRKLAKRGIAGILKQRKERRQDVAAKVK